MTQTTLPHFAVQIDEAMLGMLKDLIDGQETTVFDEDVKNIMQRTKDSVDEAYNASLLMRNATHIATVAGIEFYEHPEEGDEAPLMAYLPDQGVFRESTPFWDVPDEDEIDTWFEETLKDV